MRPSKHTKMTIQMTAVAILALTAGDASGQIVQPNPVILRLPYMECNGVDRSVNFGTDFNDSLSNTFTIRFDIKPLTITGAVETVIHNRNSVNSIGVRVNYNPTSQMLFFVVEGINVSKTVEASTPPNIDTSITWIVTEWLTNVTASVYVNGEFYDTASSMSGQLGTSVLPLKLCEPSNQFNYFDGVIRDFQILEGAFAP